MPTVLVTDSLFVPPGGPDEARIIAAGFEVERLDLPEADESTLVDAVQGKVGYLLGGIERVTAPVVEAGKELRAIAFTGSGYKEFIPAWELATERGVAISAARGANADSVAEWTLAAGLSHIRALPRLTSPYGTSFATTREFSSLRWAILGGGRIGVTLAGKLAALGFSTRMTPQTGATESDVDAAVADADIISLHVSKGHGDEVLSAERITALPSGTIVINAAFEHAVDNKALIARIKAGEIYAATDYPLPYLGVPMGHLIASNAQSGYNTAEANARTSERATTSLLNLLTTGADGDRTN